MNGSYWIKPAGRTYAPRTIVSWITDVRRIPSEGRCDTTHGTAGTIHVACSRRRRGRWTTPFRESFLAVDEAHDWLEQWGHPKERTYVVSPCASHSLTYSDWWNRITERGAVWDGKEPGENDPPGPASNDPAYSLQTLILRGNPDVIRYRVNGRGFCWLSGKQFFDLTESDLARSVSFVCPHDDGGGNADGRTEWPGAVRADLWLHSLQALVDWWGVVQGGPFGYTAGGLALSFFRSRLAAKTCLAHNNAYAKRIEALAIHGGRSTAFFVGGVGTAPHDAPRDQWSAVNQAVSRVDGPVSLYDVRSMYPFLLGDRPYPTRLQDVWENPSVDWIADALRESCVIARVEMRATEPEYPCRHRSGILYPTGTFKATLCGPELVRAIERGEVTRVFTALTYAPGRPFKRMTADLLAMRLEARSSANPGWEHFIKLLSNSFSGKMAQKKGQWERRPEMAAESPWGEWIEYSTTTGKGTRFRAMADLVQEYQHLDAEGRPMGASYAYLTAYGREMMRAAREKLPANSVVSQDTDGIWVLDHECGGEVEQLLDAADVPGHFHKVHTSRYARFYTAKHYVTDRGWVLSGYHDYTVRPDAGTIDDHQEFNPILGCPHAPPAFVRDRSRSTPMVNVFEPGLVLTSGWVASPILTAGCLTAPSTASPEPQCLSGSALFDPVPL